MSIEGINAVLIESPNAEKLSHFYRDVLGVPLEEEQHGDEGHGSDRHWGWFINGFHFAIHQVDEFSVSSHQMAISFQVSDVDEVVSILKDKNVTIEEEPEDRPFGRVASLRDPDGNLVYIHKYPTFD